MCITGLSWVVGDAEELPFDDDQFDVYTIAFGIRNVTHIDLVILLNPLNFSVLLAGKEINICNSSCIHCTPEIKLDNVAK